MSVEIDPYGRLRGCVTFRGIYGCEHICQLITGSEVKVG